MSDLATSPSAIRRTSLPVLSPVWDSDAEPLVIRAGRVLRCGSGLDCDLQIALPDVREHHCDLEYRRGLACLINVNAPVWVNDVPAASGAKIKPGDQVAIGSATFRCEDIPAGECRPAPGVPLFRSPAMAQDAGDWSRSDEQLQGWYDRLELCGQDLSEQSRRLDEQFERLLQWQEENEQRARRMDEAYSNLRSQQQIVEEERQRLSRQQERSEQAANDAADRLRESAERAAELDQLRSQLDAQAEEQASRRNSTDHESEQRRQQLDELSSELNRFREELDTRAAELASQSEQMMIRSDELDSREADLESEAGERRQELDAQAAELARQREDLESQAAAIAAESTQLMQQSGDLELRRAAVETELQAGEAALAQREAEFEQRARELEEKSNELHEKAAELAHQVELLPCEDDVAEQQAQLLEQRDALALEREEMERLRVETAQERETLSARAEELEQRESDFSDRIERRERELSDRQQQLDDRETHISERELAADRQSASSDADEQAAALQDVQELAEELEKKKQALQEWELELQARHEETAERVIAFKQLRRAAVRQTAEQGSVETESGPLAELLRESEERLQASESRAEDLSTERDQYVSALEELRNHVALLEQQADRQESQPDNSELIQQIEDLAARLEQQSIELTLAQDQLHAAQESAAAADAARETLEAQETELRERLQLMESEADVHSSEEEDLLRQVNELRDEISSATDGSAEELQELHLRSSEQDHLIAQLTEQLTSAETALNELHELKSSAEQHSLELAERDQLIAELRDQLQQAEQETAPVFDEPSVDPDSDDRDALIIELQQELAAVRESATASAISADETIRMRSRELDERTTVLDHRDDELTDWNRRLQNTEESLEAERRQLQEARQQLEQARAELQLSITNAAPVEEVPAEYPPLEEAVYAPVEAEPLDTDVPRDDATSELRSELASLFGMGADSTPETQDDAPVDVGSEGGDSVVMSFQEAQGVLLEAPEEPDSSSESESEDQDYVTRYMEQLLARNRSDAGESLPEELQDSAQEMDTPEKPPYQPPSFLEQHMQNSASSAGDAVDTAQVPAVPQVQSDLESTRRKIDLEALRQDMDSFRQVSVRSAQQALESHAIRKERSGMAGRKAVTVALALSTAFVATANAMGVMRYPMLVWGLVGASCLAVIELIRRSRAVKSRVREVTEHVAITESDESQDQGMSAESALENNDAIRMFPSGSEATDEAVEAQTTESAPDVPAAAVSVVDVDSPADAIGPELAIEDADDADSETYRLRLPTD